MKFKVGDRIRYSYGGSRSFLINDDFGVVTNVNQRGFYTVKWDSTIHTYPEYQEWELELVIEPNDILKGIL